jgi:uncharacterized protein
MLLARRIVVCLLFLQLVGMSQAQEPKTTEIKKSEPTAIWEGALKVGAIELRLVFKIEKKDGKLISSMDSPDQGANGIPIDETKIEESKVTFDLPKLKASFAGELSKDGKSIKGVWKQAGMDFPLELKLVEKVSEVRRPQTPKKPFPYKEEDVTVENKQAKDVKLAGTLSIPSGKGPFPAAILITGSGPQDRDETLLSHKPFAVIADHLTRNGIAVLRFDDRGVAKSTGKFAEATSADFATDVTACFEYLKTRAEIDTKKIGLIGHSEGGLVAPMVAATNADVGFIVLLAGPGVPGSEIILEQADLIGKAMGESAALLKSAREMNLKLFDALKKKAEEKELLKLIEDGLKELPEELKKSIKDSDIEALKVAVKQFTSPWFRYFLEFDPRPTLMKVKCPVLALNGELDLQVPPKQSFPEIEKALKAGGNKNYKLREFPKLNHLFQKSETGAPSEYAKIEETFSVDALNEISSWILGLK